MSDRHGAGLQDQLEGGQGVNMLRKSLELERRACGHYFYQMTQVSACPFYRLPARYIQGGL